MSAVERLDDQYVDRSEMKSADTASIENVDGKDSEIFKSHLEGEYSKKTD